MHKGHVAIGTVEGTGSAINVQCGFVPSYVKLTNVDGDAMLEWWASDGAGTGYKVIAVGTGASIASGGITEYDGTEGGNSAGFTIGTDADVNASGETINYLAISADA